MATIVLTIPDAQLSRVVGAICLQGNYQAVLRDGSPNPVSQTQFAKAYLISHVMGVVSYQESKAAGNLAASQAASQITLS